jgi:hypothetical protein
LKTAVFVLSVKIHGFPIKNHVIKEKISGSGRTELSTFVVRVTHFTDLEIRKLHFSTF